MEEETKSTVDEIVKAYATMYRRLDGILLEMEHSLGEALIKVIRPENGVRPKLLSKDRVIDILSENPYGLELYFSPHNFLEMNKDKEITNELGQEVFPDDIPEFEIWCYR